MAVLLIAEVTGDALATDAPGSVAGATVTVGGPMISV